MIDYFGAKFFSYFSCERIFCLFTEFEASAA